MSTTSNEVAGAAFGYGLSLLVGGWVEVEIVGVPFTSPLGHPVVQVWVPSMDGPHAYTIASLAQLRPRTKLARELLRARQ